MTPIRIPRLLAVALTALLLAGAACGGDDDEPTATDDTAAVTDTTGDTTAVDDTAADTTTADVATGELPALPGSTPCEATGTVAGPDGDVALDGATASVVTDDGGSGPPAYYQVSADGAVVSLYSEWDSGAPASAVVGIGSDSYSNGPEDTMDVAADGSGATVADVELDLAGSSDSPIVLSVTLTCG
jgi:hypothetical protein